MAILIKNVTKVPATWHHFKGLKLCVSSEIELPKPIFLLVSLEKLHPAFFFVTLQKVKILLVSLLEEVTGEANLRTFR